MMSPVPHLRRAALTAALSVMLAVHGAAGAQPLLSETPPGPVGGVPAELPPLRLPELNELKIDVPRPVRAAQAVVGMGRQRLALVLGQGSAGMRTVVDSAARDTQAVATALRGSGFVVMQRNDVTATELRQTLKEFRERLQPEGLGFIYATGLGVQIDGRNLLLAREARLDPALPAATLAAQLPAAAVALDDLADALVGPLDSPRMLVVDAAWKHPALEPLPQRGLAPPRLPTGVMALFGHALGERQDLVATAPLPTPPPTDAAAIAATPFAQTLVAQLLVPRTSGPEALRQTRRLLALRTPGQDGPWLGGDTEGREEFAEATLLDGLVPRTPEEIARETARQAGRLMSRPASARAGEMAVGDVLQASSAAPAADEGHAKSAQDAARRVPESLGNGASGLGSAAGQAVGTVGAAAGVAATVAGVAAAAQVAETAAVVSAATTAVGTAGAVLSNAAALAARAGGSGEPAREVAREAAQDGVRRTAAAGVAPAPAPTLPTAPAPTLPTATAPVGAATPGQAAAPTAAAAPAESRVPDARTRPAEGGGERPAYTPRVNPYGHAEGDTYTFQTTDTYKGEVVGETTMAIEEVLPDGGLLANGQQLQLDAQGRVTRRVDADGSVTQYEPAQALWWARPAAGERRIVRYLEKFQGGSNAPGQVEWRGSARVGKPRQIDTPAGKFEALPVESSGYWTRSLADGTRQIGQWSRTAWYAPKLGRPVLLELENIDGLGKLLLRERIELVQAQTARTLAGTP